MKNKKKEKTEKSFTLINNPKSFWVKAALIPHSNTRKMIRCWEKSYSPSVTPWLSTGKVDSLSTALKDLQAWLIPFNRSIDVGHSNSFMKTESCLCHRATQLYTPIPAGQILYHHTSAQHSLSKFFWARVLHSTLKHTCKFISYREEKILWEHHPGRELWLHWLIGK